MSIAPADLLKVLGILAVVLVHAYFVTTEYAFVTIRRTRVQQLSADGSRPAALVLRVLANIQDLVAAVQLGVTIASLSLGALAEPTLAHILEPAFRFIPGAWAPVSAHGVAVVLTFVIVTGVDIVLAELVPKTLALQNAESVALVVVRPILIFIAVFRPALRLLNAISALVLRTLRLQPAGEGSAAHSPEELKMLVVASARAGVFDPDEQEMLVRVLEFSKLAGRQVMVPRTEVIGIEIEMPTEEVYRVIHASRHTRYPVYRGTLDDVVGILYLHDLLHRQFGATAGAIDLRRLMREPLFAPDSLHLDALLTSMRRSRVHIAVLMDEFGGTAGIVTLEDILERIVGEVRDEFEMVDPEVQELPNGDALIDGLVLVSDVNERFGVDLDDEAYDTLGGLIWGQLGRRPQVNDVVETDSCRLRVEAVDGLRVATVRLMKPQPRLPTEATP